MRPRSGLLMDARASTMVICACNTSPGRTGFSKTNGRPALILASPIENAENTVSGIIAMAAHLTSISEIITKLRIGETGYAFLRDEDGKIVAHQKIEFVEKTAGFSKHPAFLARPESGKKQVEYVEGGKKVIAYVQRAQQGWTMVTQQDHDEAYAPIAAANRKDEIGNLARAIDRMGTRFVWRCIGLPSTSRPNTTRHERGGSRSCRSV